MSNLCQIYVKCMSNLCQMYALAAPLLVHFRAPKSLCASRCYALVRSTVPTKQESDRFNAAARRFAGFDVFPWRKKQESTWKICKNMQKHAFVWESMGCHVPIMFASDLLWDSMGKHVFIMFSKDLLWSWARARALRPAGNAEK